MNREIGSEEPRVKVRCLVCLKPLSANERRWTVHFRGGEYVVCCPSCAQLFNRAPMQFLEEP